MTETTITGMGAVWIVKLSQGTSVEVDLQVLPTVAFSTCPTSSQSRKLDRFGTQRKLL